MESFVLTLQSPQNALTKHKYKVVWFYYACATPSAPEVCVIQQHQSPNRILQLHHFVNYFKSNHSLEHYLKMANKIYLAVDVPVFLVLTTRIRKNSTVVTLIPKITIKKYLKTILAVFEVPFSCVWRQRTYSLPSMVLSRAKYVWFVNQSIKNRQMPEIKRNLFTNSCEDLPQCHMLHFSHWIYWQDTLVCHAATTSRYC